MQKKARQSTFAINGPAGPLEALLESPQDVAPGGCVVVCHPHPVHGGTMQNKVVHTLARGFLTLDFAALRFNFRGVGDSAGEFDNGAGELEDVLTAVAWARREYAGVPLWLAGFSFGAAMAIMAATTSAPAGLISVAPAAVRFIDHLDPQPTCPWLVVQGDQDELVEVDETIAWINELDPGPDLEVFPDAEHFFHGKLVLLRKAVEEFVQQNSAKKTAAD